MTTFNTNETKIHLLLLVPLLLAIILHANTLKNDYTYDDISVVKEDGRVQESGRWMECLTTNYWGAKANGRLYRPVTLLSLKITKTLFGPTPLPQHAVNVLLHGLNAMLAFLLLRRILPGVYPALLGSLLFAVHPVHVEAIAPVVGRSELLAFFFAMAAILFHLHDRHRYRWLALPAALLAFASKEHALAILPILILYHAAQGTDELKSRRGTLLGLVGCAAIFLAIRFAVFSHLASQPDFPAFHLRETDNPLMLCSLPQRLVAAIAILGKYVRLLALPTVLCCDYTQPALALEASVFSLDFLLGLVLHIALTIALVSFARKKTPVILGLLIYLGFLFPVSNLPILIGTAMGERLLYTPSLGFIALLCWLVTDIKKNRVHQMVFVVCLFLLSFSLFKTPLRNAHWRNNLTLFGHDVRINPENFKLRASYASALLDAGGLDEAERQYMEALRLRPHSADILVDLALIQFQRGQIRMSLHYLEQARSAEPEREEELHFNFGQLYLMLGRHAEAEHHLRKALKTTPTAPCHYLLSLALQQQGNAKEAKAHMEKAKELDQGELAGMLR